MLYMVIENFRNQNADAVYRRFKEHGRQIPEGLEYINSWVSKDRNRCFQIMKTADPALFQPWIDNWSDLVDFEIVPVTTSDEAANAL